MQTCITENGVNIYVNDNHDNPSKSITFYNPVMKIAREFVLSGLGAYCSDRTGKTTCLDAFSASGILGLLWKHHVEIPLNVTLNDVNPVSVESIKANCSKNWYTVREYCEMDEDIDVKSVEVSQEDANVLMHKRQFNFISIDPFGTTVQYLDATFKNVFHKGMVVLTSTDIAALYGKCPQVTLRNYSACTARTDYTKEMAVRILLAEAARSAAKCNKGFDVVYSLAVEHFVQVGLKIKRGANHGNQGMSLIGQILHCLHCQEWGRLPNTNSPIENPYQHLPCKCHSEKPGKTAVVLGPLWLGEIYNTDFLKSMSTKAEEYKLSDRAKSLLLAMESESMCLDHEEPKRIVATHTKHLDVKSQLKDLKDGRLDETMIVDKNADTKDCDNKGSDGLNRSSSGHLVHKGEGGVSGVVMDTNGRLQDTVRLKPTGDEGVVMTGAAEKRRLGVSDNKREIEAKKARKTTRVYGEREMPVFYYNLHARGVKNVDVPKVPKLLSKLYLEGFRGSKTSFDTHAVRTNASLGELTEILIKYFTQKK